jgi:hypothetical protein
MVFGIRLNNATGAGFVSGSSVEGSVYFDTNKEAPAYDLVAQLYGEEYVTIKYETKDSSGDYKVSYASRTRPLINLSISLNASGMIQNGKIAAGSYVVPFEIQLPPGLPSSLSLHHHDANAEIRYTLKAQLKGSGWISDYKATQVIPVQAAPLALDAVPYNGPPSETAVSVCCCFNKGSVLFGAHVNDTLCDKGELLNVSMSCLNRSTVAIQSVQAILMQQVNFSADGRQEHQNTTLATFNFNNTVEGLRKLETTRGLVNDTGSDLETIARELEEGKYSGSIQMPYTAMETFAGQLIKTQHHLLVVVNTGCCVNDPTVRIPIQVGPARVPGAQAVAATPTTQPAAQSQQEASFDFNNATTAPMVTVSSTDAKLGGPAHAANEEDEDEIVIEPETYFEPQSPSAENLIKDLKDSVKDLDFVQTRINDKAWMTVFASLTPEDYGQVVRHVDLDFDQPKVAEVVASVISNFSCKHVVAAINNCPEWNKASVIQKLLPYTKDLKENQESILVQLSEWDKTVTKSAFAKA